MHQKVEKSYSALDDASLCALVSEGSEPAFEEITRRYKGLIHSISKDYSYPGFDSGDFMQLGLIGLFGACKNYRKESDLSFKNFAALCIRRRYISLTRTLSNRKVVPRQNVVSMDEINPAENSMNPESLILDKESDKNFLDFVKGRLSFMELCALKGFVNGLSYKQIAESTGLDVKAVDNALQRVRKKLLK